jgi:hypothetical protein
MSTPIFIHKNKQISSSLITDYINENYKKPTQIKSSNKKINKKSSNQKNNFSIFIEKYFLCKKIQLFGEINCIIRKFVLDITYKIILDANDKDILQYLFEYIDKNSTLSHVTLNGLPYYERSNIWASMFKNTIKTRPTYDPDIICVGTNCGLKSNIKVKKTDNLQYIVEYEDHDDILENYDEDNNKIAQLHYKICNCSAKDILLVGYRKINIMNNKMIRGINKDHRGSTHCAVDLKHEPRVEFKD